MNALFHQSSGQQSGLTEGVAAITVAQSGFFTIQGEVELVGVNDDGLVPPGRECRRPWPWLVVTPVRVISVGRMTLAGSPLWTWPGRAEEYAAEVRRFSIGGGEATGLQQLLACFVDRRRRVVQRTQQGVAIRHAGHQREVFGEANAGDRGLDRLKRAAHFGGGVRFGVPGVEMTRAADEKEENTALWRSRNGASKAVMSVQRNSCSGAQSTGAEELAARQGGGGLDGSG